MLSGAKACKSYRSRREVSNDYLLAKFGFETAENELCKSVPALRVQIPQVDAGPPELQAPLGRVKTNITSDQGRLDVKQASGQHTGYLNLSPQKRSLDSTKDFLEWSSASAP